MKNSDKPNHVFFTVVVNGTPVGIEANVNAPLKTIIPEALHESSNQGQPPENWELKDKDGSPLDPNRKIEEFEFTSDTTLFLSLKAGIGGSE